MDLHQISRRAQKSGKLFPLPYAARAVSQIAEGLYYAHTKTDADGKPLDIVHRDVSPQNVILTFDGIPKLIDFGIAKASVAFKEDDEGLLKGKFSYMSPEQVRGLPLDPRSDIFALGIVLWEVCTGASLYRESSELLTMEAILSKPTPYPREIRGDMPEELEHIILKALAKDPEERYQTAHEMHLALEGYLNDAGWSVGAQHLSEFMHRLYPEEAQEMHELLEKERQLAELEDKGEGPANEQFVPWVPYENLPSDSRQPPRAEPEPQAPPRPASPVSDPGPGKASPRSRSRLLVGISLLLLAAGLGLWLWLSTSPGTGAESRPETLSLRVESTPSAAAVSINGRSVGNTPFACAGFSPGEDLTLRVEKEGYQPYIVSVRMIADRPTTIVKARLQPLE
jgi:serine/threonine protein kinase